MTSPIDWDKLYAQDGWSQWMSDDIREILRGKREEIALTLEHGTIPAEVPQPSVASLDAADRILDLLGAGEESNE